MIARLPVAKSIGINLLALRILFDFYGIFAVLFAVASGWLAAVHLPRLC